MSEVELKHGLFSWTDAAVPDQDAGKAFYSGLFGWGYVDVPVEGGGTYTLFTKDGKQVAGLSTLAPEQREQGVPPAWWSYVLVDDVDDVTSRVEGLGGTVVGGPFDVMESGRMSAIQDPTGAHLCLWQAGTRAGAEIFNEPGALTWNELYTRAVPEAVEFYSKLLGWGIDAQDMGGPEPYNVITAGDRPNGGIMAIDPSWPGQVPPHWAVYFAVDDVDATADKAQELGGTVAVPPTDIGVGRFAVIADDQGATFTVFKPAQA